MITIEKMALEGVLRITPDVFEDFRGEFVETYNEKLYRDQGIDVQFIQDDLSISTRNVLRGIHGDEVTWKLVSCAHGRVYLVVVDCRAESSTFGRWESFILSDRRRSQVLIPPGYGNGHLVLSDVAIFTYKQSAYYDRAGQFSYRWDDKRFGIRWLIKDPILSRRDDQGPTV